MEKEEKILKDLSNRLENRSFYCPNCDKPVGDAYCPECGRKARKQG